MERGVTNLECNDLASFLLKRVSQTLLDSLGFLSFCEGNILDCLNPLGSPFRWFERICIVMRFMCDLTISKLHDAYCMDWTPPIIGDNQFSYPEISFSTNSQDFKSNFSGVMCPEFV